MLCCRDSIFTWVYADISVLSFILRSSGVTMFNGDGLFTEFLQYSQIASSVMMFGWLDVCVFMNGLSCVRHLTFNAP